LGGVISKYFHRVITQYFVLIPETTLCKASTLTELVWLYTVANPVPGCHNKETTSLLFDI